MRFYAAWCGAEAGCISAGLGCYPEKALSKPGGGPTVNYRYIATGVTSIFKRRRINICVCVTRINVVNLTARYHLCLCGGHVFFVES